MGHRDLDGVHVLVVEDTDDAREMLRIALEYCGALVWTAESAEKAKRILETLRPHVLVTDIAMPDDGEDGGRDEGDSRPGYRGHRLSWPTRGTLSGGIRCARGKTARPNRAVRRGSEARPASGVADRALRQTPPLDRMT
jgi:hypothetical protein